RADPKPFVSCQWVSGETKPELAVIFIGRVAHHLMQAGSIQIAQQAAENMRMPQPGVARKVVGHGRDLDGNVSRVHTHRADVGYVGASERAPGAGLAIELLIALVHESADCSNLEVGFPDLALHDLPFVELR